MPSRKQFTPDEQLIRAHTQLGMLCATLARDARFSWKTRKVFESYGWVILEQIKRLRTGELSGIPNEFFGTALQEVGEAIEAAETASASGADTDAALAVVETFQAIDAVDGILGKKAGIA